MLGFELIAAAKQRTFQEFEMGPITALLENGLHNFLIDYLRYIDFNNAKYDQDVLNI